jgi:cation:H+ antiporter
VLISSLLLIVGFIMLCFGAEFLVSGSSRLALRLGIAPLVIGLTIVAFGTSAPELAVSIEAASNGQSALALGNVVGSNIANIGLILGITALIHPIRIETQLIKKQIPIMIVTTLILCALVYDGLIDRVDGIVLFCGLLVYVFYSYRYTENGLAEIGQELESTQSNESVLQLPNSGVVNVALIVVGLVMLIAGSHLFVANAITLALIIGISEAVVGLTIVAVGTSVPELATSVIAAVRRQPDIAIGNIIGSNLFNILGILGVTTFVASISAEDIDLVDLSVMLLFACVLLPMAWSKRMLSRLEGTLLLAGYVVYIGYVLTQH